jgi:cell division protein FtsB
MQLDAKSIIIILLSILLLALLIGKPNVIDDKQIQGLHDSNDSLMTINDSLHKLIHGLNVKIDTTEMLVNINQKLLEESEIKIKKLKDENSKINIRIRNMSSNDVSDAFTNYLNKRTKSKNVNKY